MAESQITDPIVLRELAAAKTLPRQRLVEHIEATFNLEKRWLENKISQCEALKENIEFNKNIEQDKEALQSKDLEFQLFYAESVVAAKAIGGFEKAAAAPDRRR